MIWNRKYRKRNHVGRRNDRLARHYAHRGFHDKPRIPENSMAAFRRAVENGFPSELDVHLIADGSLVVFHDEDLERETGAAGQIEDYDIVELKKLRLEGTDEPVPTFDEVLDLYEDTGLPLLIELKTARGNYRELTEAVAKRLDTYKGEYAVESFDPRVLMVLGKIRPGIIRGQLVQNFLIHREDIPAWQTVMLTLMKLNILARPDFIAYRYQDRNSRLLGYSLRKSLKREGVSEVSWTITSPEEYKEAVRAGIVPVFEQFNPDRE